MTHSQHLRRAILADDGDDDNEDHICRGENVRPSTRHKGPSRDRR